MQAKNWRVRAEMAKYKITNGSLGKVLGMTHYAVSYMLRYELADSEQERLIEAVHKAAGVQ